MPPDLVLEQLATGKEKVEQHLAYCNVHGILLNGSFFTSLICERPISDSVD